MAISPAYQNNGVGQVREKQSLNIEKWRDPAADPGQERESFVCTATLSALTAGTAVIPTVVCGAATAVPLDANFVGPKRTIRLLSIRPVVSNTTAWSGGTGTIVQLKDGNDVLIASWPSAALTSKAVLGLTTSGAVVGASILTGFGRITSGYGLKILADNNYGAGSDITFLIHGHIEPT